MSRRGKDVAVPRKGNDVGCHTEIGGPDVQPAHDRAGDQSAEDPTHGILRALAHLVRPRLRAVSPPERGIREGVRRLGAGIRGGLERNSSEQGDCEGKRDQQLGHWRALL